MTERIRVELARRMVGSLPKFGAWANGFREFETPHGKVGFRQLAILWYLRYESSPGEDISPTKLADYSSVQPSVITRALAKLEAHGLIARTIDPNDHRRSRITITDKGMVVSTHVEQWYTRDIVASMASLSDEQIDTLSQNVELLDEIIEDLLLRQADLRTG